MKSIKLSVSIICLTLLFSSCKKEAGSGGTSSIKGKVYARYYDKYFYVQTDSAYAPDIDVYIIYGDQSTIGDRIRTNYDGSYEFKYLRTGSYKIYAYSRDSTGYFLHQVNKFAPVVAVLKEAKITGRKQNVEIPDINIAQ